MEQTTTEAARNGKDRARPKADADALAHAREEAKLKLDELWPAFVEAVNATEGCEPAKITVHVSFKPAKAEGPCSLDVLGRSTLPTAKTTIAVHVGGGNLSLGF